MSVLEALENIENEQHAKEQADRNGNIAEYREILARNDPADASRMAQLLAALKLSKADVEAHLEALRVKAWLEQRLDPREAEAAKEAETNALAKLDADSTKAMLEFWSRISLDHRAAIAHHIVVNIAHAVRPEVHGLLDGAGWDVRLRIIRSEAKAAQTGQREAGNDLQRLIRDNPILFAKL